MTINIDLRKQDGENERQFIWRLGQAKDSDVLDMSWDEVTDIINKECRNEDTPYKEAAYRKPYQQAKLFYEDVFSKMESETYSNEIMVQKRELERKKIQFRDERNAWQKQNFIEARVEEKLNLLESELLSLGRCNFSVYEPTKMNSDNDLLVILSDLHIGQCFSSTFGNYNSDIAKERLREYLSKIFKIGKRHNSEKVFVSIQGDLISGNIHKSIQVSNRENVIEQIKIATELICSFCYELGNYFSNVVIQNVSGNHSRIDKKEDSIHDERLDDLISWIVEKMLMHIPNVNVLHRSIDTSISDLNIRGKTYINVHGDYDAFSKSGVGNLVMMLGFIPYAITYGHFHTCTVDECNGIKMIRGGSLSGSGDDYTIEKRLSGKPSQMVCVCNNKGVEAYYPVELT